MAGYPASLDVRVLVAARPWLGGLETLPELQITTRGPTTVFSLLVVTPGSADPVPTLLGANFFGNHRVVDDPSVAISTTPVSVHGRRPYAGERVSETDAWDVERTIRAGYGFATSCMSEVEPDDAALATAPLAQFAGRRGRTGAVAAWAWAFSRALDVLAGLPEIDTSRVVAVGHSRLGKAALWAAAMDQRLAAVIPAGRGSAVPRRPAGRPSAQITRRFPHWFSPAYAAVAERVDD